MAAFFFAFYVDLQAWGPLGCRQMGVAAPYAVPWRKIAVVIFELSVTRCILL